MKMLKEKYELTSTSNNEKHIKLFEKIAPLYRMFYIPQLFSYRRLLDRNRYIFEINKGDRVLDIGCGTGALASCLKNMGFDVTGVDASSEMIRQARISERNSGIKFHISNVTEGLEFEDKSFHLVIGSYIVHGLNRDDRIKLYREAKRLAKKQVIFHDFNQRRSIFIDFIEWLEGSDYSNFIYKGVYEMEGIFSMVTIIDVGCYVSWYVCIP